MANHIKDLTGQTFGYLTVVEKTDQRSGNNSVVWRCKCSCGRNTCAKEIYVNSSSLRQGNTSSCRRQQLDKTVHSAIRQYFSMTRKDAKLRSYTFDLTLEHFHAIIRLPCYYCGAKDIKSIRCTRANYKLRANGIDRVDNNIGYILENCVPCCRFCNIMKQHHSKQEFFAHIKRIYEYNHLEELSL